MKKKFLVNSIYLILILVSAFILFELAVAPLVKDDNSFLGATIDKENRLNNLSSPRLVFVGGSNLAFGIDSKRIGDSLKIEVVNMGIHAGLGLDYILAESADGLKPNDIVILSTEYFLGNQGSLELKASLINANSKAIRYVANNPFDFVRIFCLNLQTHLSGLFYKLLELSVGKTAEHVAYRRSSFNEQGDNIGHLNDSTRYQFTISPLSGDYINGIISLNKFIDAAKKKHCKVYYSFPNYPRSSYILSYKKIKEFEKLITNHLNCPILNTPETFLFPDTFCFDTVYHLNHKGREIRTDKLIAILKKSITHQ